MSSAGEELRAALDAALPRLRAMDPAAASARPRPERWSPQEELGHLVDSATNNHTRFLRAFSEPDLICPPYDQDAWVEAGAYAGARWPDLVELWGLLNHQIARVMDRAAGEVAERPRTRHNLDRVAWKTVPADEPTTLGYFMHDYVGHLRYHLERILGRP